MILLFFCFLLYNFFGYLHRCVNFIIDVPRSVQPLTNAEDLVLFGNSIYPSILFDIVPRSVFYTAYRSIRNL